MKIHKNVRIIFYFFFLFYLINKKVTSSFLNELKKKKKEEEDNNRNGKIKLMLFIFNLIKICSYNSNKGKRKNFEISD
jgi:hypothetical protein